MESLLAKYLVLLAMTTSVFASFFDEGEQLPFFYWCCIFVTFLSPLARVESEVKI